MEQDRPVAGPEASGARDLVRKHPFSSLFWSARRMVETVRRTPFGDNTGKAHF
jgi:hypothetical protein